MPFSIAPFSLLGDVSSEALLRDLLDVSLTGIQVLRPVYAPDGVAVVDFTFVYTNPVGLRMVGLSQQPSGSIVVQFPHALAAGILAYYQRAFTTTESLAYETNYQADGIDNYLEFNARRSGEQLLVSFTDTRNQPRTVVEEALRASQAREQARTQQLEAARAEAEHERALLQAMLAQAPVAIGLYTGKDLRVAAASTLMADLLGKPLGQLVGQPLVEAAPELQGQGFDDGMRQVMATQVPFIGTEIPVVTRRNGESQLIYTNSIYKPLYSTESQVIGVMSIAVDVTEQVRARQQVEQLNQELEARVQQRTSEALALQTELLKAAQRQVQTRESLYQVFEQTPAAVSLLRGPNYRFEYVNPVYQQVFAGRQLVGLNFADALPDAATQGYLALLDGVYHTGETFFGAEVPFVSEQPDAPTYTTYFNFTYQAYRESGQIVGISTFAFDVTEQVLARQERETQRQLLATIFEQAPVAIAILRGPQYVVELANSALGAIWGRTPAQALGRPLFELVPEAAGQGFEQLLDQVRATGETFSARELPSFIERNGRRDTVYWDFVYAPLPEADGTVERIMVVSTEVSEQVRARQQVQDLNKDLAALNEKLAATNEELSYSNRQLTRTNVDLDTFVYTASHDLKAPITNIEGLLIALRYQLPANVHEEKSISQLLDMMQGAVERFQLTINQLTDVSRSQHEQSQPAEQVQLSAIIENVRLDLQPLLLSTRAQLTVDVDLELQVLFSPKNLRSVAYNLLSNALKYHQPGRPPVVLLRATTADNQVVLTVQDEGLGLSKQQQERLFGLFQRLHVHVEGSGVGLYMVKRIIDNAGGTITVQSEESAGTTFTVTLPTGRTR